MRRFAAALCEDRGPMADPVVSFLTDYGLSDAFVGVCHGVIAQGCPGARIIDLTHGVAPHDVRAGALILTRALPYLPQGVHLAVVDPGVGGPRRAVALRARDGQHLVGPDNGLLHPAALACGGVAAAVDVARSPLARTPVSATFHGRDLFAPVAAGLACGLALERVGDPIDPASLVALDLPEPYRRDGELVAHVLGSDRFGNLELDAGVAHLAACGLAVGATVVLRGGSGGDETARWGRTFGDVPAGELVLYEDPQRLLSVAVNRGSAAQRLGLGADDELRISAA